MKAHAKSDTHIKASQAALDYRSSIHAQSVIQQLQHMEEMPCTYNVCVVEFIVVLGTWDGESILKCLRQVSCFSIMVDECRGVATIEEMLAF